MKEIEKDYYCYEDLIDTFEVETLFEESDKDYQGDSYYLLKDGDKYGFLVFGWGSCSGCDALEAAYGDIEALTELRDSLWGDIVWLSKQEMLTYLQEKDWKLEWYGRETTFGLFRAKAITLLS